MQSHSNFKKASFFDIVKLYGYVMKLNFQKQKRDYGLVNKEYDLGTWNRSFEEIDFETAGGNYARKDMDQIIINPINDKLVKIPRKIYEEKSKIEFLSFFQNHIHDSIVELGCGLGFNLFSLYNSGFTDLAGYDLSKNSINNLKKYVKQKKIDINFDICDLNNPLPENLIDGKVVFTNTCLEQCKHIMPNVLQNILKAKPKLVMNFEVDYDSSPYIVRKYFDSRDYQNNLVRNLKKLENQNKLEIISIQKMTYSGSPVNRRSVITWIPK